MKWKYLAIRSAHRDVRHAGGEGCCTSSHSPPALLALVCLTIQKPFLVFDFSTERWHTAAELYSVIAAKPANSPI
jgi:hypothetical protein